MQGLLRMLGHPAIVRFAQVAIGLVFVWAGLAKIGNLDAFSTQVRHFEMIPDAFSNIVAMTFPWIELVAGIALVFGYERRAAAWVIAGMMVFFTFAVFVAWMRGLTIDCGCFGTADPTPVGPAKFLQNVGLTALALVASLRPATAAALATNPRATGTPARQT